jgi:hypothetical protein
LGYLCLGEWNPAHEAQRIVGGLRHGILGFRRALMAAPLALPFLLEDIVVS